MAPVKTPAELLKSFEAYRSDHSFGQSPNELYEPIRYMMELGGKRIRPLLVLMGCDLFSGKIEEALPVSYATELFHNFSLVHDDIMDNASLRRGHSTVHQKYNTAQAILSGDVMMIYVYKFLSHLEKEEFRKAVDLFNTTAIRVCEGQQYDMNFQTTTEVSVREYLTMIEFKTAELLACSLKLGAIVAHAGDDDAGHLFDFGHNIGICFQLLDDLLDTFGEEGKFGKEIGGDIAQNKKTYLHIKALELAAGKDRDELIYYFGNNIQREEKVKHVIEIYRKLEVEKLARKEAQKYNEAAFASLDIVNVPDERKQVLRDFARKMSSRQT